MINFFHLLQIFLVLLTIFPTTFGAVSCGKPPIKPNTNKNTYSIDIVGGQDSVPYSWPWQVGFCKVRLANNCLTVCGGTIIAPGWVLTAGHCVYGDEDRNSFFRVKTGVYDLANGHEKGMTQHKVKKIYLHPNFTMDVDSSNDIALVELEDEIIYNEHVQPVCLPSHDETVVVQPNTAWATGWGSPKFFEDYFIIKLKQVEVPFVNFDVCDSEYPGQIKKEVMICAGTKGKDTCQGDSGGPLVVQSKSETWFQYGITSFGDGCGVDKKPGIYVRVTAFCDFINKTTNGVVGCIDPNSN